MESKRTVLVVDDQEVNRKLLCKILETEYQVITAENGRDALKILRENCGKKGISAVLLDIIMPVMDGYEVLREMRKEPRLARIPVIVTTQKEGETSELDALNCGANDFISKPYHPEIIWLRLKNLIQATEIKETLNVLEIDTLTGLLTKEAFYHKVGILFTEQPQTNYRVVAADIERFKLFNDTYGEEEGDRLLRHVAQELREIFGEDNYIAHGYADQFLILLDKKLELKEKFLTISKNMQNYFLLTKVIIKFGIYDIEEEEIPIRAMYDRAAMAINSIKNRYDKVYCFYSDTFREKLIVEQRITSLMNQALSQKQFQIYYQPKFDAETESIVGAEALVRWIHPQYGFMSPSEFIPVFEKNGFITELDKYVWEQVCVFLKERHDEGKEQIPISVNVSRKDIYNEDLTKFFPKLVQKYNLEPKCLHLEVTESAYSENPQQLIKVVSQLREEGFVIEMDDFGSGYSSLNALSEIPIDILKLDMKFIQNEFLHKNSNNIISSVINLAKWMNLLIVAEGVENKQQLDKLKELKCNIIQGYYFARPMNEEDFKKILEERTVKPVYDVNSYIQNVVREKENFDTNLMLVVDDLALNRAILREYFESEYNIKECDNGIAAWEFIQRNYEKIALIMLDLYMPGMDGFELLKRLKKEKRFKNIPVIVTSQATEELKEKAKGIHLDGFLPKPYFKEEALQLVADVLANRIRGTKREQVNLQQRFFQLEEASLDKLTKVLNRDIFEREVKKFLTTQEDAVLVLLSIDKLDKLEERKTTPKKEDVLLAVAEILRNSVRTYDLIGRMKDNQFAILLKSSFTLENLKKRMAWLKSLLNFSIGDVCVTCSIGACFFKEEQLNFNEVYESAQMALLDARRAGENEYRIFGEKATQPRVWS